MTRALPANDLDAAYRHCAAITKQRARNFYYGLRLTPEPKRSAIYSVYAWMRHADDLADSDAGGQRTEARLRALRVFADRTRRALDQQTADRDDPVLAAFARTVRDYAIQERDIQGMIEGLETDLRSELHAAALSGKPMFPDRPAFEQYCFRVASTVGRVCVRIWGVIDGADEEHALRLAVQRGLAFQTTNILRDFREDFDQPGAGRVYLPEDLFHRHELTPAQLRAWERPEKCAALVDEVCTWARRWYDASAPLDTIITPECRPAIRAMTRIYRSLLDIIQDEPSRVAGHRRVRVRSWRKAAIALGAVREARLRP